MNNYNTQLNIFLSFLLSVAMVALTCMVPLQAHAVEDVPDTTVEASSEVDTEAPDASGSEPSPESVVEEESEEQEEQITEEQEEQMDVEQAPDTAEIATSTSASADDVDEDENSEDIEDVVEEIVDTQDNTQTALTSTSSATSTATTTDSGSEASDDDTATVDTGDATAVASVVNVVNTNIFNSQGLILLLSNLFENVGNIDLRSLPIFGGGGTNGLETCTSLSCASSATTTISNNSSAHIDNSLTVRANTGENTAVSENGNAEVTTGDAFAAADIVNIANTNISESGYLLMTFNNFGSWGGDLIFPSAETFSQFFSSGLAGTSVENTNTANVENNVNVHADTGGNTSVGSSATVTAGNAQVFSNIISKVNTNLSGADTFSIVLRVHGDWTGEMFNAPEGVVWREAGDAIELFLSPSAADGSVSMSDLVSNTNSASISNNVQVTALTGDNHARAVAGSATVSTGNATAAANIINVANTNVVGQNWLLGIINIFGDWTGNITFGAPNLWIGGWAELEDDRARPGTDVTYHYTIQNFGDVDATEVVLTSTFDNGAIVPGMPETIEVGTIPAGSAVDVEFPATVSSSIIETDIEVQNTVEVDLKEKDSDESDNTEVIPVLVNQGVLYGGARVGQAEDEEEHVLGEEITLPVILLERARTPEGTLQAGNDITHTFTIRNDSDVSAYNAMLVDIMTNEAGDVIYQEEQPLDVVYPGEEITYSYTTVLSESMPAGTYRAEARVYAMGGSDDPETWREAHSQIVTNDITVESIGEVLGASTCTPYIQNPLRLGTHNNSIDVLRLQAFLDVEGFENTVSGEFDASTDRAVRAFQRAHAEDILAPWGISQPTGYVYHTTKKKINEMFCGGSYAFPLTPAQKQEIAYRRNFVALASSEIQHREDPVLLKEEENNASETSIVLVPRAHASAQSNEENTTPSFLERGVRKLLSMLMW